MFDCDIELLQFDIDNLEPRYTVKLDDLRAQLRRTPVLCPFESEQSEPALQTVPTFLPAPSQPNQAVLVHMQ